MWLSEEFERRCTRHLPQEAKRDLRRNPAVRILLTADGNWLEVETDEPCKICYEQKITSGLPRTARV